MVMKAGMATTSNMQMQVARMSHLTPSRPLEASAMSPKGPPAKVSPDGMTVIADAMTKKSAATVQLTSNRTNNSFSRSMSTFSSPVTQPRMAERFSGFIISLRALRMPVMISWLSVEALTGVPFMSRRSSAVLASGMSAHITR